MTSVHDSSYSWFRLLVTLAAATVINAGMWLIIALMPDIQSDFGASRASASLPFTLNMVGFAFGNFLVGAAIDRFGTARVLALSALTCSLALALASQSPSILVLSALQLVIGLTASAGFGPLIADISHWFLRRRGLAVALAASGNYLSGIVWSLAFSDHLASQGWRAVFLYMAVITLVTVLPLCLVLRRRLPDGAHDAAATQAASNARSTGLSPRALALLLGLAGIGCCVAMSMPQVHIVAYCVDLGYGPAIGAQMLSLMLLGGIVSRIISGLLADRLGGLRTLLIGSILQCLAIAAYLPSDAMISLYVVSTIFGLSQGGIVPSYALIVREYMPPREAGARVGFVLMTTIMGMALGGWMSGWIYDLTQNYTLAFWNGIAWNAMNIAIVLWLLSRARRARMPVPA